jgi:hypothetical protein
LDHPERGRIGVRSPICRDRSRAGQRRDCLVSKRSRCELQPAAPLHARRPGPIAAFWLTGVRDMACSSWPRSQVPLVFACVSQQQAQTAKRDCSERFQPRRNGKPSPACKSRYIGSFLLGAARGADRTPAPRSRHIVRSADHNKHWLTNGRADTSIQFTRPAPNRPSILLSSTSFSTLHSSR